LASLRGGREADEAIGIRKRMSSEAKRDCFASLAMTGEG
jgi:hypothetical protein